MTGILRNSKNHDMIQLLQIKINKLPIYQIYFTITFIIGINI